MKRKQDLQNIAAFLAEFRVQLATYGARVTTMLDNTQDMLWVLDPLRGPKKRKKRSKR